MPGNAAAIAAHLEWLRQRGLSPVTIYDRRRALTRLARALPVPLLKATEAHLGAWRAGLRLADSTTGSYIVHVREFYRWAARERLIPASPAERLPSPKRPRGLPRPIGETDLMAALQQANPRVRPWIVLAGWAGLRAREIACLRREDILDQARPPVLLVTAQAGKGRRERIIPLSAFVLAELHAARLPSHGWVFPRHDGHPGPNMPWLVSKLAGEHLRACGIPATLHQLRHRFGTMAYRGSHDLRAVQELLGHASPATTAGYAAYDRTEAAAAVESLPAPAALR